MLKRIHKKFKVLFICLVLAASILVVFWQVGDHGFITLDDDSYVINNPTIKNGFTYDGITCVFTYCSMTEGTGHWHPLTWLSLMLDYELYGLNSGGYHITNLIFHLANTILLFLLFHLMTQELWKSAFVAALFALHPLHVESVAWVTERKDVLSFFFGILAIGAYVFYTKRPGMARYLAVVLLFACALMAKSMLITLPFLLILLDYWPLRRFQQDGFPPKNLPADGGISRRPWGEEKKQEDACR